MALDTKIPDLVELGKTSNAIKIVLNEHLEDDYERHLENRNKKHSDTITRICHENYTQFIDAIDDLMDINSTVGHLRTDVVVLNNKVQSSGVILEKQAQALQTERYRRRHIELALRQVQRCQNIVNLILKVDQHIADKKYINALKIINQLKNHHLPPIRQLEFIQLVQSHLPAMRKKIENSVKIDFQSWCINISKRSVELGRNVDKVEEIDFGPVYQCLHVYECLGEEELQNFAEEYKQKRKKALEDSTKNIRKNTDFDQYFQRITGFFVVEKAVVHRYHRLMTQNEMRRYGDIAIQNIKTNLNNAYKTLSDHRRHLQIKVACLSMCKSLEPFGLDISILHDFLIEKIEDFCTTLGKKLNLRITEITSSSSIYKPWKVYNSQIYEENIAYFQLEEETDNVKHNFPLIVQYSEIIPEICKELVKFLEQLKEYTNDLPNVRMSNWSNHFEQVFNRDVLQVIRTNNLDGNNLDIGQMSQLYVSVSALSNSSRFFEQRLNLSNENPESEYRMKFVSRKFRELDNCIQERIHERLFEAVEGFMEFGFDLNPKSPEKGARKWSRDLVDYLVQQFESSLKNLEPGMFEGIYYMICSKIVQIFFERLEDESVKKININGIFNLSKDLEQIENWARNNGPESLDQIFMGTRQCFDLILSHDILNLHEPEVRRKYQVQKSRMMIILSKWKPVKGFAGSFGKNLPPGIKDLKDKNALIESLQNGIM